MKKDLHYCLNCGQELDGHRKYCNTHCQMEFQYKQYIDRWKNGLENGLRGEYQVYLHIRRYLFDKYNSRCSMCGWGEMNIWTGCIPLEVHHIDGDYMNNTESNLALLCPNCHSLTETYKALNKNGRVERKKYYN